MTDVAKISTEQLQSLKATIRAELKSRGVEKVKAKKADMIAALEARVKTLKGEK